jgi:tetratricopeptide (TPR) repeat protein
MTSAATERPGARLWRWLPSWRRPWRLALFVLIAAGLAVAGVQGWAWYELRAGAQALDQFHNDSARAHLERCLRIWPGSADAHLLMARAERRARHFSEAEQHLDQCRQAAGHQENEAVALEWALLHAAMGDLRSVEESLLARLERRPAEAPLIWEALAEGYRRTCRMPEALACLDNWGYFEPDNAHIHFMRGELFIQAGALSRTRDEFQMVVDMDPDNDSARRRLASSLVQLGRYDAASDHLRTLLRKTPDDAELGTLLARAEHDLGRQADAVARLDAVLNQHPEYGPALRERGRAAATAGDHADAERWLRRAIAAMPYDYDAHVALQRALQAQGRGDEAKEQLAVAAQLKDRRERISAIQTRELATKQGDPKLQCELGQLLLETGQRPSAEGWLLSALRLDPTLADAHRALAELYQQQGDTARAAMHRRAASRAP